MNKQKSKKYCSCLVKVSKKQSVNCLKNKKSSKKCYNPYAICTSSLKRKGNVNCSKLLDYNKILKPDLYKYALAKGKKVTTKMKKSEIIKIIKK